MKQKSNVFSEAIIVGFAMFAVFFGAGNLIFPPYLGMQAGVRWFLGFLCFVIADAGLAIMSVLAMVKSSGSLSVMLNPLGKKPSKLLSVILILCVGPLVAIPSTCTTTFEMGILPLFPRFNSWIFGLIFFGIVALLTIRPTAVVDIIGKFLTPALLITLAVLCIKGVLSPIGSIAPTRAGFNVAKEGFLAGYQTMDVLGAVPVTIVIMKSVTQKGYLTRKEQYGVMIPSSIVAFIGLFVVYGGLCYLGATTSLMDLGDINQAGLVVTVTELLLRRLGVVLLGLIVFFACLTTAVGLTSSSADFFSEVFHGKISYKALVLIICGMGIAISNVGISAIIKLASPLLTIIYPVILTQVVLSFFSDRIRNANVFRGAVLGALIVAVLDTLCDLGVAIPFVKQLPLAGVGFSWLIPAVLGGVIGCFIRARGSASAPQTSDV